MAFEMALRLEAQQRHLDLGTSVKAKAYGLGRLDEARGCSESQGPFEKSGMARIGQARPYLVI